jgi:protein-disulfide isomerase
LNRFRWSHARAIRLLWIVGLFVSSSHAQTWGPEDAPVTLMIYSGFTCPYCAQAKGQIDSLKKKYPNDLRIVFKHFPLSDAEDARRPHLIAAAAAEQGKFWEAHDSFFERPNTKALGAEMSLLLASRGINMQAANAFIESGAAAKRLSQDSTEANALKVRATPTYFIEGVRLEGLQDLSTLERLIEFRLKRTLSSDANIAPSIKPPTPSINGSR